MTLMQLALSSVSLATAATAGSHAVIYKREPRSAAIWVIIIALMPLAGPVLYFILGINRVKRRAASLREDMVRHRTQPDVELRDLGLNGDDFEFNVECYDATLGAQLERLANDRRECAQQLTLERVNGRSFPIKLRDGTVRLFAPYL
jgi:Phospholipase_D-nuclease N-terminal